MGMVVPHNWICNLRPWSCLARLSLDLVSRSAVCPSIIFEVSCPHRTTEYMSGLYCAFCNQPCQSTSSNQPLELEAWETEEFCLILQVKFILSCESTPTYFPVAGAWVPSGALSTLHLRDNKLAESAFDWSLTLVTSWQSQGIHIRHTPKVSRIRHLRLNSMDSGQVVPSSEQLSEMWGFHWISLGEVKPLFQLSEELECSEQGSLVPPEGLDGLNCNMGAPWVRLMIHGTVSFEVFILFIWSLTWR
jgi:hypothetical protein